MDGEQLSGQGCPGSGCRVARFDQAKARKAPSNSRPKVGDAVATRLVQGTAPGQQRNHLRLPRGPIVELEAVSGRMVMLPDIAETPVTMGATFQPNKSGGELVFTVSLTDAYPRREVTEVQPVTQGSAQLSAWIATPGLFVVPARNLRGGRGGFETTVKHGCVPCGLDGRLLRRGHAEYFVEDYAGPRN